MLSFYARIKGREISVVVFSIPVCAFSLPLVSAWEGEGGVHRALLLFYYTVSMISPVLVDTAARRSGLVAARNVYLWYVTALLCLGHSQSKE